MSFIIPYTIYNHCLGPLSKHNCRLSSSVVVRVCSYTILNVPFMELWRLRNSSLIFRKSSLICKVFIFVHIQLLDFQPPEQYVLSPLDTGSSNPSFVTHEKEFWKFTTYLCVLLMAPFGKFDGLA